MIETDGWDGALWILSRDLGEHQEEFQKMRDHFQRLGVPVECHAQPGASLGGGPAERSGGSEDTEGLSHQ
jgi:hypothetical protein